MLTTDDELKISVRGSHIFNETTVKLLDMTSDNKISFESRYSMQKVSHKPQVLTRASNYISKQNLRIIMKGLTTSHFGYCLLVWMCHNRKLYDKINNLHERALRNALRLMYKD